ncbi:GntR family transcriptional regulator [Actinomycetospora sp. TBRC 11914]|uniref:GntR family transcriptional regulator n=1 Tax=Actinomycetospora sp. TBRC 11914 TaxID=2729387 RepID=UPI00145FA8B6|nr:GntR family transcriptional regulator [Actinomycetospora sp. TBRC 11914]NMO92900.1 GntR family transcriptional regulator [Actinomycetospora sp. TBRC 11914]
MSDTSGISAAEAVYRHVKDRVLTGELEGGRMVSEGEVSGALGVSRTPVREAFLRLEVEGWLRLFPKRGALVVPVAPHEIDEVLDARALLEGHAAADVVTRPADLAALVDALDAVIGAQRASHDAGDLRGYTEADVEFHRLVADAGRNSLLAGFHRTLRERQQRMTAESVRGRTAAARTVLDEHRALRDLLAAGDAAGFGRALVTHLDNTHRGGRTR